MMRKKVSFLVNNDIEVFNDRFKYRDKMKYQKFIDRVVARIPIKNDCEFWKNYIEATPIIGYSSYAGDDVSGHIENMEFQDEAKVYFIYKVVLELIEKEKKVSIHIDTITDKLIFNRKVYIDDMLALFVAEQNTRDVKLVQLNSLAADGFGDKYFNVHKNVKNITDYFLQIKKSSPYRVNPDVENIDFDIKLLTRDQTYKIKCPICLRKKTISYNNQYFKLKQKTRDTIEFMCDHENSKNIGQKRVSFRISKEIVKKVKSDNVDLIDFVLYNYKYFFKELEQENEE